MSNVSQWIIPTWPAPSNIKALTTTRLLNHIDELDLPSKPVLLKQVHGSHVLSIDSPKQDHSISEGDGVFTALPNIVCGVKTADCVPVLICSQKGEHVAAVHAGWKGIKAGVLESALKYFPAPSSELLFWLGPFISVNHYEVQEEMKNQFEPEDDFAFKPQQNGRYHCDLSALILRRLQTAGISNTQIFSANLCTYQHENLFDSYRRDYQKPGGSQGRMMTLIWRV